MHCKQHNTQMYPDHGGLYYHATDEEGHPYYCPQCVSEYEAQRAMTFHLETWDTPRLEEGK